MADIPVGIDQNYLQKSLKNAERSFRQFTSRVSRTMGRVADQMGQSSTMVGGMLFPSNRNKGSSGGMPKGAQKAMKASMKSFEKEIAKMSQKSLGGFKKMNKEVQALTKNIKAMTKAAQDASRAGVGGGSVGGGGSSASSGGGFFNRGNAGARGGRGGRGPGRARRFVSSAAGLGMGGILGFTMGAFREGVSKYEQVAGAQLEGATTLGANANFRSGLGMGFNPAEAARIQAQAASAGLGDAKSAFQVNRVLGQQGIELGGGLARRGAGSRGAMRQLAAAMATGMETGLERARIGEFLQSANQLAEQQIAITPTGDQFKGFVTEMANLQGVGVKGRYAGGAIGQAHKAIQGASGAGQAFLMRAFGFGQGDKGLLDVLRQQEKGVGGGNIGKIMERLRTEFGANAQGGLSDAGKMAFKSMGLGSIGMADKFEEAYLLKKQNKLSEGDFQAKVKEIKDKGKEAKLPSIQVQAYKTIKRFGGVAQSIAERFADFAAFGQKNYDLIKKIRDAQKDLLGKISDPLVNFLKKGAPTLFKAVGVITNVVSKGLVQAIRGITGIFQMLRGFYAGFTKGYTTANNSITNPFAKITAGFTLGGKAAQKAGEDVFFNKNWEKVLDKKEGDQAFNKVINRRMEEIKKQNHADAMSTKVLKDDLRYAADAIKGGISVALSPLAKKIFTIMKAKPPRNASKAGGGGGARLRGSL